MTEHAPRNGFAPPAPDAEPVTRAYADAPVSTTRTVIRVTQPDLARRAQLEKSRPRLLLAAGGFALLFGAVALKLAIATVIDPAQPRRSIATSRPAAVPAEAPVARGTITDRNGEILAVSLPLNALYANPRQIDNPREVADRLVRVLPQLNRERLVERLQGERQFAYIARALTPREMQQVNNLGVAGLYFETAERRYYPQGRTGVHIVGGVDVDGNGIAGVERYFDERLRARPNLPLRLSLDVRVQLAMRDAVQRAITEFTGIGGAGILMDVHTNEVLAMVSLPDYDANDPMSAQNCDPARNRTTNICERFNRVTSGVYEPGSTFKLLTAAMALENGLQPHQGYDASRPITIGRFTINDFRGRGRWLALPEILQHSSNLASAHMAAAVGPTRHREFMGRMGMLTRQSVELPEVASPLAPSARNWREINTMTIGFGHGISVTPLHVVTGVSAIVNGGILRQPTLVAQQPGTQREGVRVISERTSDIMRRMMRLVVTDGSGRSAEVPGYYLGGKTGTAQKTGPRGGYLENRRIAAFVGAFPMNAPRYALYVMVDEPHPNARSHGYATAGWVAAPAANMVVSRVAPILGLMPEPPTPEIVNAITIPPNGRGNFGPAPPRPPREPTTPIARPETPRPAATPTRSPQPPSAPVPFPATPPGRTAEAPQAPAGRAAQLAAR